MSLKNNVDEQREYLKKNLEQVNTVVSAVLGIKTHLKIKEKNHPTYGTTFSIIDDRNIRDCCGVMAHAFREVIIEDFGVWWHDDGVSFQLDFSYQHIDLGSNGAKFCTIDIIKDFVKIR